MKIPEHSSNHATFFDVPPTMNNLFIQKNENISNVSHEILLHHEMAISKFT